MSKEKESENVAKGYSVRFDEKEPKKLTITFTEGLHAEITRAMLLMAGWKAKDIGFKNTTASTFIEDKQNTTLELKGLTEQQFDAFYELTYYLTHQLRTNAELIGMELSLPHLKFDNDRGKDKEAVYPSLRIVASYWGANKEARPHRILADSMNDYGFNVSLEKNKERFIDVNTEPGKDLTAALQELIESPQSRVGGASGPFRRGFRR